MLSFISIVALGLVSVVAVPVTVFVAEIIAATLRPGRDCGPLLTDECRGTVAVLVPAHNESAGMLPTLADIKAQMRLSDRLLVVADNCADDTADVAAAAGAEVLSRQDSERPGKGYALDFGLCHLSLAPPDVVIVIDADCRLADNALEHLVRACERTGRPAQALYLMEAPDGSLINYSVAEFAWRIKNIARPAGLLALGLPCLLTGTGMAFPWKTLRSVSLASGSIVEDMKLGLDLALAGNPPIFCPDAKIISQFPFSTKGIQTQRRRWEMGHIDIIFSMVPHLVLAAVARANLCLLALALDVAVPPLSLLALLVFGMLILTGLMTFLGASPAAFLVSVMNLAVFACGVFLSWSKFGRDVLPASTMLSLIPYALGKLPLYGRVFYRGSGRQWIRTDRQKR